jgi:hypothetical protein
MLLLTAAGCAASQPDVTPPDVAEGVQPPEQTPTEPSSTTPEPLPELLRIPLGNADGFVGAVVITSWAEDNTLNNCYTQAPVEETLAAEITEARGFVELPTVDGFQWSSGVGVQPLPQEGQPLNSGDVQRLSCSPDDTAGDIRQSGTGTLVMTPPYDEVTPFAMRFVQLSEKTPNEPRGTLDQHSKYPGVILISDVAVDCASLTTDVITVESARSPGQCLLKLAS